MGYEMFKENDEKFYWFSYIEEGILAIDNGEVYAF
jgi:hypothetical protein